MKLRDLVLAYVQALNSPWGRAKRYDVDFALTKIQEWVHKCPPKDTDKAIALLSMIRGQVALEVRNDFQVQQEITALVKRLKTPLPDV